MTLYIPHPKGAEFIILETSLGDELSNWFGDDMSMVTTWPVTPSNCICNFLDIYRYPER